MTFVPDFQNVLNEKTLYPSAYQDGAINFSNTVHMAGSGYPEIDRANGQIKDTQQKLNRAKQIFEQGKADPASAMNKAEPFLEKAKQNISQIEDLMNELFKKLNKIPRTQKNAPYLDNAKKEIGKILEKITGRKSVRGKEGVKGLKEQLKDIEAKKEKIKEQEKKRKEAEKQGDKNEEQKIKKEMIENLNSAAEIVNSIALGLGAGILFVGSGILWILQQLLSNPWAA